MPGIAGQVDPAALDAAAGSALRLVRRLWPPPPANACAGGAFTGAAFAHAAVPGRRPQLALDPLAEMLVAVDGEILEHGKLVADPASLLLARCVRAENESALTAGLGGAFAAAIWDGRRRQLLLVSDPFGLRPLHWRAEPTPAGKRITFASQTKALLDGGPPAALDERTLAEVLLFGMPLFDHTLLEGVRILAPGTVLTATASGIREHRWFRLEFRRREPRWRLADWSVALAERLRTAVGELAPEPAGVLLPLSGGLDSRTILAALVRCGKPVESWSLGSAGSDDLAVGPLAAARAGIANHTLVVGGADVAAWIEAGVWLTDGACSAFDTHILAIARLLPAGGRAALDGVSSCDGYHSLLNLADARLRPRRYEWPRAGRTFASAPLFDARGQLCGVEPFAPAFRTRLRDHLAAALAALRASAEHNAPPFDQTDFLGLTQRVPRYNAMGTMLLRSRVEVRHPFFHPAVVDLVTAMPLRCRSNDKPVIGRALAALAPILADVPYQRTGLPPAAPLWRLLLHRAGQVAHRAAFARGRARPSLAIDYPALLASAPALQDLVRRTLLSPQALGRAWVDARAMRVFVERQLAGHGSSAEMALLGRLVALELWQRFALDRDLPLPAAGGEVPSVAESPTVHQSR